MTFTTVNRRNVAAELIEPLEAPGTHQAAEPTARNAVALLQHRSGCCGIEEAERAFEDGTDFIARLQHIDRIDLHQRLEPLRQRGLAAADRAEQIEDLLALLEPLRGVTEETDDALDRLFHAEEFGEGRIDANGPVHEDAAEPLIPRGVDELGLADRVENSLGGARIGLRIVAAQVEIGLERHLGRLSFPVRSCEASENVRVRHSDPYRRPELNLGLSECQTSDSVPHGPFQPFRVPS